ncbi:histidine N-alpha-methyltransferase-like isoform X1 [Argopecten irradians]|uniref:histidine N-alpha-methyltransferase-like isoform X1 n=1 Tax=Argopecten irradians TaxID=31199 RepID=UPI0037169971
MEDEVKQMLVAGLNSSPKYIPCWYNYDDQGSTLQQESGVLNQDYYLTRSQISFLQHRVQDIIPDVPNGLTLVDLGSGDCSKTRFVIDELIKRQSTLTFYPLDISGDFLLKAAAKLREEYGDSLAVFPVASDYVQGINQLKQVKGAKLILWIGSMINLPYEDQISTLRLISTMMTDQCRLVFTADITESRDVFLKAYNDDAGVKRTFYQYGVTRLNREEGSMINLDKFSYHLDFVRNTNPQYMSYVTSYVVAKEDIQFTIPGLGIDLVMAKGEQLFFHEGEGLSCKYTLEQLQTIVEKAGLRMIGSFKDTDKHVAFCQCATK